MSTTSILAVIGVFISFYKILSAPKDYIHGLFKDVNDKEKTDSLYLIIVFFSLICAPAYFIFDIPLESLDIIAVLVLSLVFGWKMYEILKAPKFYFQGLFAPSDSVNKTTFEPITMVLISLIVNYAYFTNVI